jgi:predicted permease
VLLRALSVWHPVPRYPLQVAVNPDARVYAVALLLTLISGLLFGAVPVRSILRTDPYEVVKSGSRTTGGKRITFRDVLLVAQIAICSVLVTSSLVAVRGLARSLQSNFGFAVENTILVDTDLTMAGYSGDRIPAMQKRMLDALKSIPGVESVGFGDGVPMSDGGGDSNVFTDNTTDLRPGNAAADAYMYNVSPEYFHAAGTTLLSGRAFTWHDDKNSPRVAVVNRQFSRKLFGDPANAMGRYFKRRDGTRYQVVGIVEDGKYNSLTEDPTAAMFFPILQTPSSAIYMLVRSTRDFEQLAPAIRNALRELDPGLAVAVQTRLKSLDPILFAPRMATMSLGVMGAIGAVLAITGIFGMAAFSVSKRLRELGIRVAIGAQPMETLRAALGRPVRLLALGSFAGLLLGFLASRVLSYIVYEATPRDPIVLAGVVLAMALLGLIATWIPAQRALSLDPMKLLREE